MGKEIARLETAEISLTDMDNENSAYVQEGRLKQKYMRVWKKLMTACEEEAVTDRPLEQPFRFTKSSQTRWPALNRRLEYRVNRRTYSGPGPKAAAARCPVHSNASSAKSKSHGRPPKCLCPNANRLAEFGQIVDYEFPDFPDVLELVKKLVRSGKLTFQYSFVLSFALYLWLSLKF